MELKTTNYVEGYKVFEPDWTCRGFRYKVGETFEKDAAPTCCNEGFHFCKELKDCFYYYSFNSNNKVARIVALGEVDAEDDNKYCTNKIRIVEEISWEDVLKMVNAGEGNTGFNNTGNYNSGDLNSGNYNSGNCNNGDWNNTDFSNGCFNTEEQKIHLFNKPSDWTYRDWLGSDARYVLNQMPNDPDLICNSKQIWWDNLSADDKNVVMSLPNFDAEVFEKCTGIKI